MVSHSPRPLPPSLYAQTARSPVVTRPLDGDRRVSVAIVGGGFTGLSAALHLAERGVETLVLEAHEPGWGASGRNGGQVNPGLKHDPDEIVHDFGPERAKRMIDFSWNATNALFDLVRRHGIDCDARQNGTLRLAPNQKRLEMLRSATEQLNRHGVPVELLNAAGVASFIGSGRYVGALLDRSGGDVNPLGLARGLADAAQRAGATICSGTPALSLEKQGSDWKITTPSGTVLADKVVLATNGYTDGLWPGLRQTVIPLRSSIASTEPLSPELAAKIMPTRSSAYEIGRITVYYRVDQGNRLLMGGRGNLADVSGPGELGYLTRYAEQLWPLLKGLRWTYGWNGNVAITQDHYPHLHEPAGNLLICMGYNGRGVALSTALGPEIAKRVIGGATADIELPILPIKPFPFHAFWPIGAATAIYRGRLMDKFER